MEDGPKSLYRAWYVVPPISAEPSGSRAKPSGAIWGQPHGRIGDYTVAGLGFNSLQFAQEGDHYTGALYWPGGYSATVSGATYTDSTSIVTFSLENSPAGITDLLFTAQVVLDPTGNVTALAGSWTSRSFVLAPAAAAAAAPELAVQRLGPNPIVHAHGACVAFNRQPII